MTENLTDKIKNLFHGNPRRLDRLMPSINTSLQGVHGSHVYATESLLLASAYAMKAEKAVYAVGQRNAWTCLFATSEADLLSGLSTQRQDKGGYIYAVDPAGFVMAGPEWLSDTEAVIMDRSFISLRNAMRRGVQVFLCDHAIYRKYYHDRDPARLIGAAHVDWLNEMQGINPLRP